MNLSTILEKKTELALEESVLTGGVTEWNLCSYMYMYIPKLYKHLCDYFVNHNVLFTGA